MQSEHQGLCVKCRKKTGCKVPCAPVEAILSGDNPAIYERVDHRHDRTILYSSGDNGKMVRESTTRGYARDKAVHQKIDALFSTDSENPFADYNPKLKQTAIFIHRLLLGQSYEEIAGQFNTSVDNARKIYHKAHTRILKALDLCDKHQSIIDKAEYALKVGEQATGKLPKYVKWLLMAKCLGLSPHDIARIERTTQRVVSTKIRYAYDRLITGEQTLFPEVTPEEIEAAKARIEKKRASDRGIIKDNN